MNDKDTKHSKICFRNLSFERKLEYLWDYYKFHLLGIIIVLALMIGSLLIWHENSKPVLLNGYLLNTNWGDEQAQKLLEEYASYGNYPLKEYNAYFNASVFIDTSIKDQMSTVAYTKVMSDLDMKEIDFFFCNQEMFNYFGEKEAFGDLEKSMPANLQERFQDKLISVKLYDEEGNVIGTYAAGINISDSPVLASMQKEHILYEESQIFFTVPYNSQRLEKVWEFLEFLYYQQS